MNEPWWKVVWSMIRRLPDFTADWIADHLDQALLVHHDPEDVGDPIQPWCLRCKTPWPCDEFVRISDRRMERKAAEQGQSA